MVGSVAPEPPWTVSMRSAGLHTSDADGDTLRTIPRSSGRIFASACYTERSSLVLDTDMDET